MYTDPVLKIVQERGVDLSSINREKIIKNFDLINLLAEQDWRSQCTIDWSNDLKKCLIEIRSQKLAVSKENIDVLDFSYPLEVISMARKIRKICDQNKIKIF
jgi:hypothetical protein